MRSISRRSRAVVGRLVLLAVSAIFISSQAAEAADQSAALKELIAAASKEGKLELQWGSTFLGGNDGVKAITEAMNAMFGTHIVARFTPGPNANESLNAIMIAQSVNRPSPTDVFIGSNQHGALIYEKKAGTAIDWHALLPDRIAASSIEADGMALRLITVLPGGIVYNTQRVPYAPTKLEDLLKPEWKGKIASTPYASGFDLLSSTDVWGSDKTLDFARKLSAQLAGLMRCNEIERIASGEFIAYAMDCTGTDWQDLKRKGAPVGHVIPADFPAVRFNYVTVPKNAANPNAAKLFSVFLHTPEGQKLTWKYMTADLHTYADSQMAKEVGEYEKKGVVFHQFTIQWYLDHPEAREGISKVVPILTAGR